MKSDKSVVACLNKALFNELTAINQYFLHAKMMDDWGFEAIAGKERAASIDEMKHADQLIDRILFLDGLPNLQNLGKLLIGETVKEMLECDLKLEMVALPDLKEGVAVAEAAGDYVSRDLLRSILDSEEEHVDWLETQLELIDKVGEQNYLQSQMS